MELPKLRKCGAYDTISSSMDQVKMELSVIDRNGKIVNKSPSWLSIDDENGEIKFESSTFYQDKYVADWSGDIQLFVSYEIESEEEDSWSWV